ncbi:Decapping and exoribonuclease protein [Aphelenchoides besseyi]|nr:Decapping and exoribonuclease protein [Aphelenchoides besseyi]KAI6198486.1 Decapping and exoribonuclease protein [Aphelenchoides besseyi]
MFTFHNQFTRRANKDNDYASSSSRRQFTPIWQPQFSSFGNRPLSQSFTTSRFTPPRVSSSVRSFSQTAPSQQTEFVKSVKCLGGYAYNFRTMEINVGDDELRLLDTSKIKGLEGYDLSRGIENFRLDGTEENEQSRRDLPTGFRWLMETSDRNMPLTYDSEFACKRSLLVSIATANCSRVLCVKFGRTIFMCDFSSKPIRNHDDEQKLYIYTGKKFEKILTKPQPWIRYDDQPAGNGDAYYAIFRVVLGSTIIFKVLVSAEVDGIDDGNWMIINGRYIEIKSCQQPLDGGKIRNKAHWWLQSYLVGIDRLFVGIKEKTIVRKIIELKNSEFRQNEKTDAFLNHLESFLKRVRSLMRNSRTFDDHWLLMEKPRTRNEWRYRWLSSEYDRAPYREFVPDDFYTYFGIRRCI